MQVLSIIILSVLACITYGVIHDQITARICVEYFTIGHPRVVPSVDPTVLACVWGVIATWWVGAILGIPLAVVSRAGCRPPRDMSSLVRPISILFAGTAILAVAAGVVGYVAASNGWVILVGPLAQRVPVEKHVAFIVDLWAHVASYFGGFAGGIFLIVRVWRERGRSEKEK
jgi:hypothetical protein